MVFGVEITWEPPDLDLDSRIDFYHYQILVSLSKENATDINTIESNTTNTTVIIIIIIQDRYDIFSLL